MAFKRGDPKPPGSGRKKGQLAKSTIEIKEFMLALLDDKEYREGLKRRIKNGELPQVELFMLNKTLGKPVEEVKISANVPLFALPVTFKMGEDE